MRAVQIWKAAVEDKVDFLDKLIDLLRTHQIQFCVIGGQGVNAYAEPLISLDLDLVVAARQIEEAGSLLEDHFEVQRFSGGMNISAPGSNLRVQIQTDPRYFAFTDRAASRDVLGRQRIGLDRDPLTWIKQALAWPRAELLPISPEIAVEAARLAGNFRGDPADRLPTERRVRSAH